MGDCMVWNTDEYRGQRGQISTEMIIILAILLAIIVLIATNLQKIVKQNVAASEREGQNISGTISEISGTSGASVGSNCNYDYECQSGICKNSYCE